MRKRFGLPGLIAIAILALVSPAFPQSGGQVSRKNGRSERGSDVRDAAPARDVITDDDLLEPSGNEKRLQEIEELESQCLNEVNRLRQKYNLAPLRFSEDLLEVARRYSRRMAEENFFSHNDPEGRSVRERVEQASIKWRMVGENLAYSNGYINPVAMSLHGWMESPGHRRNLLDPGWRQTAVGVWISANGTVYFTEIFLTN
ncbi:MAG TPA: CAP domain-containing protein [Blastocatellia bacterium]|nr:CAP domain-containing protein [Blastocatellia bacterium]